jgi:hypothetical protein
MHNPASVALSIGVDKALETPVFPPRESKNTRAKETFAGVAACIFLDFE